MADPLKGIAAEVDVVECTKGKDIAERQRPHVADLVELQDSALQSQVPGATVPPALEEMARGTAAPGGKFRVTSPRW